MAKKKTAVEIMNDGMEEESAGVDAIIEEARPKTPFEAAFDRATDFKPEDAVKAILGKGKADPETEQVNSETKQPEDETKPGEDETAGAEASHPEKRDWVKETYECFVKDAKDIDPTDPVKAIEVYFEKNATDELKAWCKAEGKDAKGCWEFIEAVAHKALGSSGGHIDPAVVYAIAMHWFEDVPKDWDTAPRTKAERSSTIRTKKTAKKEAKIEKLERKIAQGRSEPVRQKAKEELRKAKAAPKRKSNKQQGFFFDLLETPAEGGTEE